MFSKGMQERLLDKQLSFTIRRQHLYTFDNSTHTWNVLTDGTDPDISTSDLSSLVVLSWNIDFMAPEPRARMASALNHLEHLISEIPSSSAVVILLQEMMEDARQHSLDSATDLSQIAQAPWVQSSFNVTDLDGSRWNARYGQVTLIDRRLKIKEVSRLPFVSEFQRDALLVDIHLKPLLHDGDEIDRVMRICNVHLDSMAGSMRPIQWKGIAQHLQDPSANLVASILAGDCNSNRPRDWTEPQNNGFKDSYLELGGTEDDETGSTWGFQSRGWERWGRKRMDKQVYWGETRVRTLQRIGVGVEVEDIVARGALESQEELTYVTDHYGLMGVYDVEYGFEVKQKDHSVRNEHKEADV